MKNQPKAVRHDAFTTIVCEHDMRELNTSGPNGASSLLEVSDLVVEYSRGRGLPPLRAVDGVSLALAPGETVGLVGESGSGKSTIGRAILGLAPINDGKVVFDGDDITHAGRRRRQQISSELQVIFQDPYSSLSPTRTVGQSLAEMLRVPAKLPRDEVTARVQTMLKRVGLPPDAAGRYPANFSGGQRQRIAIARALMRNPRLVICDEPVSALDLSVQAQVLNLLRELQSELGLSYLFIAHDLPVVRHLSHRIVVLYCGRVMEQGDAATLYANPVHPYTRELLEAVPFPDPEVQRERRIGRRSQGTATTSVHPEAGGGCPFVSRCAFAIETCLKVRPHLDVTPAGSQVACHRWAELGAIDATRPRTGSVAVVPEANPMSNTPR